MSILKETGETIKKFGESFLNKTEEYTQRAKLSLEVKKLEGKLEKELQNIGEFVLLKAEKGLSSIDLHDDVLQNYKEKADIVKKDLNAAKEKLADIKDTDTDTDTDTETQEKQDKDEE